MQVDDLRKAVIAEIRTVIPQVTDWNTLLALMKVAGQSFDSVADDQDMFLYALDEALWHYGEKTRSFHTIREHPIPASPNPISYRSLNVLDIIEMAWRVDTSGEWHALKKAWNSPSVVDTARGTPYYYIVKGSELYLYPEPSSAGHLRIEGIYAPYVDRNNTIIGVDPAYYTSIAKYIAARYITAISPEHSMFFRQLVEAEWTRLREHIGHRRLAHRRAPLTRRLTRWRRRWW